MNEHNLFCQRSSKFLSTVEEQHGNAGGSLSMMKRNYSKVLMLLSLVWILLLVKIIQKDINCTCTCDGKESTFSTKIERVEARALQPEQSVEHRIRAVQRQVVDMWYYIQSWKRRPTNKERFIDDMQSRKNAILVELEMVELSRKDAVHQKLNDMRAVVEHKIRQAQEPRNCSNVKKLLCGLGDKCGFGCQLHHVAVCFTLAIGMRRILILDSSNWAYSRKSWEEVFLPISSSSCKINKDDAVIWRSDMTEKDLESTNVVRIDDFNWQFPPSYLPLRIPKYLHAELTRYHGDPAAWWMGNLVSYLIRPQPWLSTKIYEARKMIGFERPIAGIHIRRTDKLLSEAAPHDLSEYMLHVADWFDKESMRRERMKMLPLQKKRVYIASDDPRVLDEAMNRYPDFVFLGDKRIAFMDNIGRYSLRSVVGVMIDVTLLSQCDFFVGTLSSGMSRLVYELMQVHHADPTNCARSLDDRYYYVNQFVRQQRAIYDHEPHNLREVRFKVGDFIATRGDHWDGFSVGTNTRTNKRGLYPTYKTEDIFTAVDFNFLKPLKHLVG